MIFVPCLHEWFRSKYRSEFVFFRRTSIGNINAFFLFLKIFLPPYFILMSAEKMASQFWGIFCFILKRVLLFVDMPWQSEVHSLKFYIMIKIKTFAVNSSWGNLFNPKYSCSNFESLIPWHLFLAKCEILGACAVNISAHPDYVRTSWSLIYLYRVGTS